LLHASLPWLNKALAARRGRIHGGFLSPSLSITASSPPGTEFPMRSRPPGGCWSYRLRPFQAINSFFFHLSYDFRRPFCVIRAAHLLLVVVPGRLGFPFQANLDPRGLRRGRVHTVCPPPKRPPAPIFLANRGGGHGDG